MADVDGSPLVSVVLPTYGRPELLTDAVESVLAQTYAPIELLVVDDCSPEPVEPVVTSSDAEAGADDGRSIRVIRHEDNRGASAARNTGIENAAGTFVAFIDDDDVWAPTKIERQLAAFEGAPGVGLVCTGMRYLVDGEPAHVLRPEIEGDPTRRLLLGEPFGTFSTQMVRASVVESAGLLDERFPCWQDREWPIRLSRHCDVATVPEPLVDHRTTGHEQITDDFETKRDVAFPLMVETFRPVAAEYGRRTARKFVATWAEEVAVSGLKSGDYGDARRFALRAIRTYPVSATAYLYLGLALGGRPVFETARRAKRTATSLRQ